MVGMTVTDIWYLNERFPSPSTVKRKRITFFADEIANFLLEHAATLRNLTLIPREQFIFASPIMHTKQFITTGQRRCLWCSHTSAKISKTYFFAFNGMQVSVIHALQEDIVGPFMLNGEDRLKRVTSANLRLK